MLIRLTLVSLLLGTTPAFAEMATMQHATPSPAARAYAATMDRMMKGMDAPMSGNADTDFARMMIPHHQGAIEMAKVELQYGQDPAMLALARAVVAAQESEIATMKSYLATHR